MRFSIRPVLILDGPSRSAVGLIAHKDAVVSGILNPCLEVIHNPACLYLSRPIRVDSHEVPY